MSHQIPNLKSLFPIDRFNFPAFDFINQVDRMYKGLGIPTLYGVLSILANKSVFFIAEKGHGKTRVINLTPKIEETIEKKMDTFTLSALDGYQINDEHLVLKVEDFSTTSKYHRDVFLGVFSKMISDGNYYHHTKGPKGLLIDIKDCKLTVLVAIQPQLYSSLCDRYEGWENMASDRFSKFVLLNPLRSVDIDEKFVPTLPRRISNSVKFSLDDVDLSKVIEMYRKQISVGRAFFYARNYVIALARFLGAEVVQQEHVDLVYQLFYPYLNCYSVLQRRENLNTSVRVSAGNLKLLGEIGKSIDYVEKKDLANELHVEERSIERPAKELLEAGLIEKPSPKAGRYRLSELLRNFFNWYRGLIL